MINLYDEKTGKITAQYDEWKRADVELDIHNGSLSGSILQCEDVRHFEFVDGKPIEKSADEKYADKLISKKERDDALAAAKAMDDEVLINQEIRAMARERLVKSGKI